MVPDVCPNQVFANSAGKFDFSMTAGEFIDVYAPQKSKSTNYHSLDSWDSVVTCFFIDTAHNICEYLECINKILKKGGIWVNLGPLLWHYSE